MSRIRELIKQRSEEGIVDRLARQCEEASERTDSGTGVGGFKRVISLERFQGIVMKKHWEEVSDQLVQNGWDLSIDGFRR